jgi:hypothetical protein
MTIYCQTIDSFLGVIAGLVERGIHFEANAEGFLITLR